MTALAYVQVPQMRIPTGGEKTGKLLLFPRVPRNDTAVSEPESDLSGAVSGVLLPEASAVWKAGVSALGAKVVSRRDFENRRIGAEVAIRSTSELGQDRVVSGVVTATKQVGVQHGMLGLLLIGLYQACLAGLFENNVNRSWQWTARGKAVIFGVWVVLGLLGLVLFAVTFFSVSNASLGPGGSGLWNSVFSYSG